MYVRRELEAVRTDDSTKGIMSSFGIFLHRDRFLTIFDSGNLRI